MSGCKIRYDNKDDYPLNDDANKRVLFSYLGSTSVSKFIDMPREVIGSASDKFENGKARAIYSTRSFPKVSFPPLSIDFHRSLNANCIAR